MKTRFKSLTRNATARWALGTRTGLRGILAILGRHVCARDGVDEAIQGLEKSFGAVKFYAKSVSSVSQRCEIEEARVDARHRFTSRKEKTLTCFGKVFSGDVNESGSI